MSASCFGGYKRFMSKKNYVKWTSAKKAFCRVPQASSKLSREIIAYCQTPIDTHPSAKLLTRTSTSSSLPFDKNAGRLHR